MGIILILVLVLLGVYLIYIYNRFITLSNLTDEAWSGIDVQLQKRHDLVPTLVEVVKNYAAHEKSLLENITKLRNEGIQPHSVKEQETIEVGLSKALGNLFVVVEDYPELKANENFLGLQKDISAVEHDLQRARRYYNGTVRNYNILVEQFPSMWVAKVTQHKQRDFFDIKDETQRAIPTVNL